MRKAPHKTVKRFSRNGLYLNLRPARQPEHDPVLAVNRHAVHQPTSNSVESIVIVIYYDIRSHKTTNRIQTCFPTGPVCRAFVVYLGCLLSCPSLSGDLGFLIGHTLEDQCNGFVVLLLFPFLLPAEGFQAFFLNGFLCFVPDAEYVFDVF